MLVKQIRSRDGTGTLSYLLIGKKFPEAVLIDPNLEDLPEILSLIKSTGVRLTHIFDTHTHADHISGAGELSKATGALVVMHENTKDKWKVLEEGDKFGIGSILRPNAAIAVDQYVAEGDVITTGDLSIRVLYTPGHTDNHVTLVADDSVFTGDLLLIGQAGRSDLPGGDPGAQYDSLVQKILTLPDRCRIYPGHDYSENEYAVLGSEKKTNPFLQHRSKEEYIAFVRDFFPPIAEAVAMGGKMTLQCGTHRVLQRVEDVKNMTPRELAALRNDKGKILIVDVREPAELLMIGAIEGVVNIPVGQLALRAEELPADKSTPIVCVCQSGGRSLEATHYLQQLGYSNVRNLAGGTGAWMKSGLPVVRPGIPAA